MALIKIDEEIKNPSSQIPQNRNVDKRSVIFLNSLIIAKISFKLVTDFVPSCLGSWNKKPPNVCRIWGLFFLNSTHSPHAIVVSSLLD